MNDECPNLKQMLDYLAGTASDHSATRLIAHVNHCSTCERKLRQADAQPVDNFLRLLRRPPLKSEQTFLRESAYREAVANISTMPLKAHTATQRQQPQDIQTVIQRAGVGDQVREYELLEVLGQGGMGVVFKARHSKLNRVVALKIISAKAVDSPLAVRRFEREMETVGRLDHPNIVRASDAGEADGLHFLVMDYVDGTNLSQLIRRDGPQSITDACRMVRDAAIGLQHVHENGLVHRDIKPGNLMLDTTGQIRLLDLGLARLQKHPLGNAGHLTATGEMMGTIDYMSPEQADNTRDVDIRADVYSLGATLFALLVGHAPFGGKQHDSTMKKVASLATQNAPSVRVFRKDVPKSLAKVIAKMLRRSPDARFQTPEDVAAALKPFCTGTRQEWNSATAALPEKSLTMRWRATALLSALVVAGICMWAMQADIAPDTTVLVSSPPIAKPIPTDAPDATVESEEDAATKAEHADAASQIPDLAQSVIQQLATADPQQDGPPWDVFSATTSPDLRTEVIHSIPQSEMPVDVLITRLKSETDSSAKAALLLTLGEFDQSDALAADPELPNYLLTVFRDDPDAGVHSAAEWVLDRWGFQQQLEQLTNLLQQKLIPFEGGWYINTQGVTMVVLPGPIHFTAGSPPTEAGRNYGDLQTEAFRDIAIDYTFAVAAKEITREQYWRTRKHFWRRPKPLHPHQSYNGYNDLTWNVAVDFNNRFSALEGLGADEHCYVELPDDDRDTDHVEKSAALQLTGYRLPTDAEWEYACRAGQSTSRPFGDSDAWLHRYARCGMIANQFPTAPGLLKPNDFGLFDMLGNVSEWCHDLHVGSDGDRIRRVRGGSAWTGARGVRAAARYGMSQDINSPRMGIRMARTLRRDPFPEPLGVRLLVGPPAGLDSSDRSESDFFAPLELQQIIRLGKWPRGGTKQRRFKLANSGAEAVTIKHINTAHDIFKLTGAFPAELAPGDSIEFGVQLTDDNSEGPRAASLEFEVGTQNQRQQLRVTVAGNLSGPIFSLMEKTESQVFDYGRLPQGGVAKHVFSVLSGGIEPLEVRVAEVTGPFRLTRKLEHAQLGAEQWGRFEIETICTTAGLKRGSVRLTSNDGANPEVVLPLQATVIEDVSRFPVCGVFRDGRWQFDYNHDGKLDNPVLFGASGDTAVAGDIDGDGRCDIGVCRPLPDGRLQWRFALAGDDHTFAVDAPQELILSFGSSESKPILADVDGDGRCDVGVVTPSKEHSKLLWSFDTDRDGFSNGEVLFGELDAIPVIGHWNGTATAHPGFVVRGEKAANGIPDWYLSHEPLPLALPSPTDDSLSLPTPPPQLIDDPNQLKKVDFGNDFDHFVVGDWNADGHDETGSVRSRASGDGRSLEWHMNLNANGLPAREFRHMGLPGDQPVVLSGRRIAAE